MRYTHWTYIRRHPVSTAPARQPRQWKQWLIRGWNQHCVGKQLTVRSDLVIVGKWEGTVHAEVFLVPSASPGSVRHCININSGRIKSVAYTRRISNISVGVITWRLGDPDRFRFAWRWVDMVEYGAGTRFCFKIPTKSCVVGIQFGNVRPVGFRTRWSEFLFS